jgi:acetoacetyl-CoA reductase
VAAGYSGNEEAAQACARELGVMVVKGNVGSFEDCDRAVRTVEAELGPVDVLVNNAGITRDGVFHKMSPAQWSDVIRVNMDSVFNMTRQVIEGMREREWGRIVNISSINGQKGQMGQTNYAAAKAGMIGFTKALALENARKGVTVNCICPRPFWPRSSPRFPWAGSAGARRSPTWSPSCRGSTPASSPGPPCL